MKNCMIVCTQNRVFKNSKLCGLVFMVYLILHSLSVDSTYKLCYCASTKSQ